MHCRHASRDWSMCATINAKPTDNARVKLDFTRGVYRAHTSVVAQPPHVHGPGFSFFNERKSATVNVYGTIQRPVEKNGGKKIQNFVSTHCYGGGGGKGKFRNRKENRMSYSSSIFSSSASFSSDFRSAPTTPGTSSFTVFAHPTMVGKRTTKVASPLAWATLENKNTKFNTRVRARVS